MSVTDGDKISLSQITHDGLLDSLAQVRFSCNSFSFMNSCAIVDGTIVHITAPFEASLLHLDGTETAAPCIGFNVVELLTYWVHNSLQTLHSVL